MKTKKPTAAADDSLSQPVTPLKELLDKKRSTDPLGAVEKIDGVLIGVLQSIDENGNPHVAVEQSDNRTLMARSLVAATTDDLGRQVALSFEVGDPRRPVILGFMHSPANSVHISAPHVVVETDEGCVRLHAEKELELRCGEAVILMEANGQITLRGEHITSHASAGQRIRGGSVQIN